MVNGFIVVGACYLDTILTVPHYPVEDAKLRASSIVRRRGGNGPNTLEVLFQLLHHPVSATTTQPPPALHLISTLPSKASPAIATIISSLGTNVDISKSIYRENESEPASSYIIRSQLTGSRTIVNFNALSEMTVEEFMDSTAAIMGPGRSADEQRHRASKNLPADGGNREQWWIHFEGRIPPTTQTCIQHLRNHYASTSLKISVELEKPERPGLFDLACLADVVFYSRSWAVAEGYSSAKECVSDQAAKTANSGPRVLICTWGDGPSAAFDRREGTIVQKEPGVWGGGKVVDAVGAGDTFIAGILFMLMAEDDSEWGREGRWEEVLGFANRLAGLKIQREGFGGLADDVFGATKEIQSRGSQD